MAPILIEETVFAGLILAPIFMGVILMFLLFYAKGPAMTLIKAKWSHSPVIGLGHEDKYFEIQSAKRVKDSWIIKDADGRTRRVFPIQDRLYALKGARLVFGLFNPWQLSPIDLKTCEASNVLKDHNLDEKKDFGYNENENIFTRNISVILGSLKGFYRKKGTVVSDTKKKTQLEKMTTTHIKVKTLVDDGIEEIVLAGETPKPVSLNYITKIFNPKLPDTFESVLKRTEYHTFSDTVKMMMPQLGKKKINMGLILLMGGVVIFIIIIAVVMQGGGLESILGGGGPFGGALGR